MPPLLLLQDIALSIVPLIVGDTKRCVALTNALFARGIDVQPIVYPGVKERAVRLRFFINRTTGPRPAGSRSQVRK